MSRKIGSPKSGGRKAGTPNKITAELRERIKVFLESHFDIIEKDFMALDPERQIVLFERYLKFVLPQLQSISVDLSIEGMTDMELSMLLKKLSKHSPNDKRNA